MRPWLVLERRSEHTECVQLDALLLSRLNTMNEENPMRQLHETKV
jgi:hypothetical protein